MVSAVAQSSQTSEPFLTRVYVDYTYTCLRKVFELNFNFAYESYPKVFERSKSWRRENKVGAAEGRGTDPCRRLVTRHGFRESGRRNNRTECVVRTELFKYSNGAFVSEVVVARRRRANVVNTFATGVLPYQNTYWTRYV